MSSQINVEKALNDAVVGLAQHRDPIDRAKRAGELLALVRRRARTISEIRQRAIAEAVQWPEGSLAKVASALDLSKSTVAKMVTPDVRDLVTQDLRARLAKGINPPPLPRQAPTPR